MSIMTRLLRLCRADVHGVMDQLEDKGLLLKQYVREMDESLGQKERRLAGLAATLERLNAQTEQNAGETAKLEQDLELALAKAKDDIARMLIRRLLVRKSTFHHLAEQIEATTQEKKRLSETLERQRLQYESLKLEADAYCRATREEPFDGAARTIREAGYPADPSDAEVELELLQRKETLKKGGAA